MKRETKELVAVIVGSIAYVLSQALPLISYYTGWFK